MNLSFLLWKNAAALWWTPHFAVNSCLSFFLLPLLFHFLFLLASPLLFSSASRTFQTLFRIPSLKKASKPGPHSRIGPCLSFFFEDRCALLCPDIYGVFFGHPWTPFFWWFTVHTFCDQIWVPVVHSVPRQNRADQTHHLTNLDHFRKLWPIHPQRVDMN